MLATRPFLFSLIERYVDSDNTETEVPAAVGLLLQICIESTRKTIYILTALQQQSLLGTIINPRAFQAQILKLLRRSLLAI